jgi:TonB family protein
MGTRRTRCNYCNGSGKSGVKSPSWCVPCSGTGYSTEYVPDVSNPPGGGGRASGGGGGGWLVVIALVLGLMFWGQQDEPAPARQPASPAAPVPARVNPVAQARPAAPAPKADAAQPSAIVPPRLAVRVEPQYPAIAREARVEGRVNLTVWVQEDGRLRDVVVTSGPALLRDAAQRAVAQWRYEPATRAGQAIGVPHEISVHFKLAR